MPFIPETLLSEILKDLPSKTIAVVGDVCLDKYLDIDPDFQEASLETSLPVWRVRNVRTHPGGAGNVVANLASLGIGTLLPIGYYGDDGEGYELEKAFQALGVSLDMFTQNPRWSTATYFKPVIQNDTGEYRELNRLDRFPLQPLHEADQTLILQRLDRAFNIADAVIVSDYREKGKAGIIEDRVRDHLVTLAKTHPEIPVLVDSRESLGQYPNMILKPNAHEAEKLGIHHAESMTPQELLIPAEKLAKQRNTPLFVTLAENGILACHPKSSTHIPALPTRGPIDIVGAGDAVMASLAAALATGASPETAARLGMLVANITIHKLGITGVATPREILEINRGTE